MRNSHSGHVPIRVPAGWDGQSRDMVIQTNRLFDDLYRRINRLERELTILKKGDEHNGGTDSESEPEETGI